MSCYVLVPFTSTAYHFIFQGIPFLYKYQFIQIKLGGDIFDETSINEICRWIVVMALPRLQVAFDMGKEDNALDSSMWDHGFYVHFCLFDGASSNISFLRLLSYPHKLFDKDMIVDDFEVLGETILLGMDVKIVVQRHDVPGISSGKCFQYYGTTGAVLSIGI